MIELVPAIDIIDGKCVRLTKGDYNSMTVYDESPVEIAVRLESQGFSRLHVVDLDGAKSDHVVNIDTLKRITASTSLKVDFGGGIKSRADIENVFESGASMINVGSVAVTNKDMFIDWLDRFGVDKIILVADVRGENISINGWKEETAESVISFLEYYAGAGVKNVMCTDISKDGTLEGPAFALYKKILSSFPNLNLIASGGVSCVEDIKKLEKEGLHAVVFGKAMYEGKINIETLKDELCCNVDIKRK